MGAVFAEAPAASMPARRRVRGGGREGPGAVALPWGACIPITGAGQVRDTEIMEQAASLADLSMWIMGGAVLLLLMCSGFFSGSETALTAASRGKLHTMADEGSAGAKRALVLTEDNERLIGGILLGNNLANITATSIATVFFTRLLGESGVAAATLAMTALVVIFAEVLPKTYAITNSERASALVAPVVGMVIRVLSPVVVMVSWLVRLVLRVFGVVVEPGRHVLSIRDEILGTLQLGHSEGVVEKEDRDRLIGALDLGDRTVEEIMRHRSSIEMIDADAPPRDIVAQAINSPHTRLPIYRDDPENIVGVMHAKDLLRAVQGAAAGQDASAEEAAVALPEDTAIDVMRIARKPYFVPETTTLDDQMRQFLRRHTHFALVVDEYGDLQGLITLEDILEEIVGEITDEFDAGGTDMIRRLPDGKFLVDGAMTIRDLNRARDWALPDDAANTVAGLVIHEAQMIPVVGQVFVFHGFRFEIAERTNNRITALRISPTTGARGGALASMQS